MKAICESNSFQAGHVQVPAFTLHAGEWLVIEWPENFGSPSENQFYDLLSGSGSAGLLIHVPIGIVSLFGKRAESLYQKYTVGELQNILPREDRALLNAEIDSRRLAPDASHEVLPATPKLLAGIMLVALSRKLIVFTTAGLDPLGIRKIHAQVSEKSKSGLSFIEMEFPGTDHKQARPGPVVILKASRRK